MIHLSQIKENAGKKLKKNFFSISITLLLVGLIPFIIELVGSFLLKPLEVRTFPGKCPVHKILPG